MIDIHMTAAISIDVAGALGDHGVTLAFLILRLLLWAGRRTIGRGRENPNIANNGGFLRLTALTFGLTLP